MADQKVVRQNVLLKSGMGTVSTEDYDPKVHGPAVEETDEQYESRITGRPVLPTTPAPGFVPGRTTIAGLATFDPASVPAPPAPVAPAPLSTPVVGQRVAVEGKDEAADKAKASAANAAANKGPGPR